MTESKRGVVDVVLERVRTREPVAVMVAQAGFWLFAAGPIDRVFERVAEQQYTRRIAFSAVVDAMSLVVLDGAGSVRRAHERNTAQINASLTALYEKINHTEPKVVAALVTHVTSRAAILMRDCPPLYDPIIPGLKVRVVDGNHQAATHRRLAPLRGSAAGPLPSMALVVYAPEHDLPIAMVPDDDAYTQERALVEELGPWLHAGECWIADRNFCTMRMFRLAIDKGSRFVVREHAALPVTSTSEWKAVSTKDEEDVSEQWATVGEGAEEIKVRRIRVRLSKPTRDGDTEVYLLTNVTEAEASAEVLAAAYRKRWTIEKAFARMERLLNCEIASLGHPNAALLAFGVGLCAYALISVIQAMLAAAHGAAKARRLSWHKLLLVASSATKLVDWIEETTVRAWQRASLEEVRAQLLALAKLVAIDEFLKVEKKKPSGPKKPRTRFKGRPHISTRRALDGRNQEA
jgi:IS4 transposase